MSLETIAETRRQVEICNACRYCEGFCSVFPALQSQRSFANADLTQLANLCHNCRGCYYACQYTAPHEFDLNLPRVLAELRTETQRDLAWPGWFAGALDRGGAVTVLAVVLGVVAFLMAASALGEQEGGTGFYAVLPHEMMVAIFLPAFLLPLVSLAISLRRYWRQIGGGQVKLRHLCAALGRAATVKDLAAGHGKGCNFEDEDRFSRARQMAHHAVLSGFLLCFAATASGTVLHYVLDASAPYPFWSLPKLLGVPGGILLAAGSLWMAALKLRSDRAPGNPRVWGAEMGFILLLALVAISGLALYAFGSTRAMPALLSLHLGSVLAFFLLAPFGKMAHGFYRLAAILEDAMR